MLIRRAFTLGCGLWLLASSAAHAHFLWIASKPHGKSPTAQVYFSESATPDDPELLDRVLMAEAFALGGRRGSEPQPLKLTKEGDALSAELTGEQTHSPLVLRHTYGVTARGGNEAFLLKYYAKSYPLVLPGTWRSVRDPELLPLEVVPRLGPSGLALEVLWQGKTLPGAMVTVEGPGIEKKLEGPTDDKGVFTCKLPESGIFSIRARHIEAKSGERDGKAYASVRHYSTLALPYVPAQVTTAPHDWPAVPRGVTSFGAAVVGDSLYVYGGYYGKAHEYFREDQSGDLLRLNLRNPGQWEHLPGGPKATGLAMVAHGGKLYRLGGFMAKNAESEKQDLWSQSDFASFDPETKQWQTLPALPEPRSSFDAVVLGDVLYVVGGWRLQGEKSSQWHDTAWSIHLSAPALEWKALANPPFHRRALTLAAWQDKIYCIGGMQEQGGPTTAVGVYDPATNKWSDGPAILGTGMDGFGASAFACGRDLYATTMSGSVQRLASAGDRWEFVGQLDHPRFFHRVVPWQNNRLVIVGGASMVKGKIEPLELLPLPVSQAAK